jgi:predicted unusual protein kinase regulating ubiquinone biosynthesis (AarF/ABC1/UbiB family)
MRLVVILWRLLPIALAFWRDHRRWLFFGAPARRTSADHERRAFRLVASLAALGPTFVKMAQLFAGRTDLLAPAYARALTTLTDQVPQVPLAEIERVIREEYGAAPRSCSSGSTRSPSRRRRSARCTAHGTPARRS